MINLGQEPQVIIDRTIDFHLHLAYERHGVDVTSKEGGTALNSLRTLEAQKQSMTPEQLARYDKLRTHFRDPMQKVLGFPAQTIV